jgi:hypothetical protein
LAFLFYMLKFLKQHRKEIFISLGTGLILYFIEPILNFLGGRIVTVSISISKSFSDSFYKKLAEKDLSEINEWTATIVTWGTLTMIIFGIIFFQFKKIDIKRRVEKINSEVNPIESDDSNRTEQEMEEDLKLSFAKLRNAQNRFSKLVLPFKIINIILFCFIIFIFAQIKVRKDLIVSFNNKIEALKPYLDAKEIDKLNSRWVLIKNSNDFDNLNFELKGLLARFNINLK